LRTITSVCGETRDLRRGGIELKQDIGKLLNKVFEADGLLAKYFPTYEPRDPQIKMAECVCRCLLEGKHGLIEAGTGTGKSLGYAIAAALWSAVHGKKVVLSTFTITLQNQLVNKDLPIVKKVLADLNLEINFELGKGRSHYICKRRLDDAITHALVEMPPDFEIMAQLQRDINTLEVGDRNEITYDIPFWREIQGDSSDCLGEESPHHDNCFIQQARNRLKAADVIVSNHALFFTDFYLKQKGMFGLFPDYDAVIFDEGHRIEDVFSKYFQKTASVRELENLFDRVLQKRSQWAKAVLQEDAENGPDIEHRIIQLRNKAIRIAHSVFAQLTQRMVELESTTELLNEPLLTRNPFVEVLEEFAANVESIQGIKQWEKSVDRGLENMRETILRMRDDFEHLIFNQDAKRWANWIDVHKPRLDPEMLPELVEAYQTVLSGAPIEADTVLRKTLFQDKTVILTSATLTTAGNFEYMSGRLGMDDYLGFQVDSPFDYQKQAMLIVPTGGPQPKKAEEFLLYSIEKVKEILSITGGRTFLLFTSYVQMTKFHELLQPWLEEQQIVPLLHTRDVNREILLTQFKSAGRAVLFGAESFWEGVDVPGDDLVCVVIVKLPFSVPSEPLVSARCAKIVLDGGNDFEMFMLPNCILRLKQGYGRLIRTVNDRGAVVILDSRVITARFGKVIMNSLPPATFSRKISDLENIVPKQEEVIS